MDIGVCFSFFLNSFFVLPTCATWSYSLSFWVHVKLFFRIVPYLYWLSMVLRLYQHNIGYMADGFFLSYLYKCRQNVTCDLWNTFIHGHIMLPQTQIIHQNLLEVSYFVAVNSQVVIFLKQYSITMKKSNMYWLTSLSSVIFSSSLNSVVSGCSEHNIHPTASYAIMNWQISEYVNTGT